MQAKGKQEKQFQAVLLLAIKTRPHKKPLVTRDIGL
jgi:hypothetical protein